MMSFDKPFYRTNKEWYYYDEKERMFKLTSKAPKEARESYEKEQKILDEPFRLAIEKLIEDKELLR